MTNKVPATYETEVLGEDAETKIKSRLKRKKLSAYDADRINTLRQFKNELQDEIGKAKQSAYFTDQHGRYCDMQDYDVPQLIIDMGRRFPTIPIQEIKQFVPFAVFTYHVR